jgi:Sec23/Sec24 trunk domain
MMDTTAYQEPLRLVDFEYFSFNFILESSNNNSVKAHNDNAVQAGVYVDLFAMTDEYTDLASLMFLSIESCGSLFFYSNTDASTLPQDM